MDPSIQIIPILENQMDKKLESEMEAGFSKGAIEGSKYTIQIIPTSGP